MKQARGEGDKRHWDGSRDLGPELGTALLRKLESSRNGGGRERRVISIVQCGRQGGWGGGGMAKPLKGWQRPEADEINLHPLGGGGSLVQVQSGCHPTPH